MKQFTHLLLALGFSLFAVQTISAATASPGQDGSSEVRLPDGSSSLNQKTISSSFHSTDIGAGLDIGNVNTFSGSPSYSVSLGALAVRDKIGFPITLYFGGNTREVVRADNGTSPTGTIGLGWNFSTPSVSRNTMGTFSLHDDVYYADLGSYGGGQLLRNSAGQFFIESNPYVKITYDVATTGELLDQIVRWTFTFSDGVKYFFGENTAVPGNAHRTLPYTLNGQAPILQISPYRLSEVRPYVYKWDLKEVQDAENSNKLLFGYKKRQVNLFNSTRNYTQESHLDTLRYLDKTGGEAEKWVFIYSTKIASEYMAPHSGKVLTTPSPYETQYLSRVDVYQSGFHSRFVQLYSRTVGSGRYTKRLLDSVVTSSRFSETSTTFQRSRPYAFTYENASRFYMLKAVTQPSLARSEFTYGNAPLGVHTQQNTTTYSLKGPNGNTLNFTDLGYWMNRTQCDERFCYLMVARNIETLGDSLYLNVIPHTGNYFDEASSYKTAYGFPHNPASGSHEPQVMPYGDYFLAYGPTDWRVSLSQWNGQTWNPVSLPGFKDFGDGRQLSVYPAKNYFLVKNFRTGQHNNTPTELTPVIKTGQTWTALNQGTTCQISNAGSYGETFRSGTGCMKWDSGEVLVRSSGNYFLTVHKPTGIFHFYALNKNGDGWVNLTDRFVQGSAINSNWQFQNAAYPNNWDYQVLDVQVAGDYFVVKTFSYEGTEFQVMHFDGTHIRPVAASTDLYFTSEDDLEIVVSDDYFLEANRTSGQLLFWKKVETISGSNRTISFQSSLVRSDVPAFEQSQLLDLKAFPNAFVVGYGSYNNRFEYQPNLEEPNLNDYLSYLYQVDYSASPSFRNRTSEITFSHPTYGTSRLANLTFSPSDNSMIGVIYRDQFTTNDLCFYTGCERYFVSFKVRTQATSGQPFLSGGKLVPEFAANYYAEHKAFTPGGRLGALSMLDLTSNQLRYRLYQFDGDDYEGKPDSVFVVTKYVEKAGLDSAHLDASYTFSYNSSLAEYNIFSFSPMYQEVTVARVNGSNADQGKARFTFNLDYLGKKLKGKDLRLNGTLASKTVLNKAGQVLSVSTNYFTPPNKLTYPSAWPPLISINRLDSMSVLSQRPNQSRQKLTTSYSQYNNVNGQPRFTKQKQGDRWLITESLFNSLGLPIQSIAYDFPTAGYPAAGPAVENYTASTPFDSPKAISSTKSAYSSSFPYLMEKGYLWRDRDPSLTEADLKSGKEPVFDVNRSWVQTSQVTRRNSFTQVVESKAITDSTAIGDRFSSFFYEGRRSLPVAVVPYSKLDNSAVLMGENGEMSGLSHMDSENRWSPIGATFSSTYRHTGRYGIKVTDNFGPRTDIYLKDVRRDKFGYRVSAWIYRPAGSTGGGLTVERFNAAGTFIDRFNGVLVPQEGETGPMTNRWQLWEVNITHAQLIANSLFNSGVNDRIRIWVGTGAPTGNSANILYVDNIVARPDNATFSLTTYDFRGLPTSQTDASNLTRYVERDFTGGGIATRDENFRILTQTASHRIKESATAKHARGYSFGFEHGNLIPNWSFEGLGAVWDSLARDNANFNISPRFPAASMCSGCKAVTGAFVGRVTGSHTGTTTQRWMLSSPIPVKPSQAYTFSMFLRAQNVVGTSAKWAIRFYSDHGTTVAGNSAGPAYTNNSAWTLYRHTFTAPANAVMARLVMLEATTKGDGGTFHFDDLVLEEGTLTNATVQARRNRVMETVNFGDGFGRSNQSQIKITVNADQTKKYILTGTTMDAWGRPDTSALPSVLDLSQADYRVDMVSRANSYWNGSGGRPQAGGYAYTQVRYFDEPGARGAEVGTQGSIWCIGAATSRTNKGDFYYVGNLNIPTNIEAPPTDANDREYLFSWSKDEDGNYALSWANIKGQVVQTAGNINKNGSTPNLWTWSRTRFDYYRSGRVKRVRTPLDVDANNTALSEVSQFTASGTLISKWAPGRGLTNYWYNRSGQLRWAQDSGQKVMNQWTFMEYDRRSRLISTGTQSSISPRQSLADLPSYSVGTRAEKVGYIYDGPESFNARTGLTLTSVMPEASTLNARFARDRLWASYNRNADNTQPGYAAVDKFVADFNGFNAKGQLITALKLIGPIRNSAKRRQKATYIYDIAGRVTQTKVFKSAGETALSNEQNVIFDALGRAQKVTGLSGKHLATFAYYDWGALRSVILGGDGTSNQGTRIEYFYHIQGWIREIKATQISTGRISFQQFLGYEGKANSASQVPNLIQARYTGQITQQLYKFASDVNVQKPVRLVNYNYNELGQMLGADYRHNANATPLNTDESINFGALTWSNVGDGDSYLDYDKNGRILGQRTGGVAAADSARYVYQANTYKLDRVTGKLAPGNSRNMGTTGNFVYNARGALVEDKSKKLKIEIGWDMMPVKFTIVDASGAQVAQYQFYDASGNRVSRIETHKPSGGTEVRKSSKNYGRIGNLTHKEWHETYSSTGTISSKSEVVNLYGQGQVGKIRKNGVYEFYLNNHQGSTIRTVDDKGGYRNDTGSVIDYMPYGDQQKIRANSEDPTEKFTGKEYEDLSRLYYFGARFYDAELALWGGPDPAEQFKNPYAYGFEPLNGIDVEGLLFKKIWRATKTAASTVKHVASEVDRYATGTPSNDNVLRRMYRSAFGSCGASSCGDADGDGIDDSYNSSGGVKFSNQGIGVTGGSGWEVGPGTTSAELAQSYDNATKPLAPIVYPEAPIIFNEPIIPEAPQVAPQDNVVAFGGPMAIPGVPESSVELWWERYSVDDRLALALYTSAVIFYSLNSFQPMIPVGRVLPKSLGAAAKLFKPPSPNQMNQLIKRGQAPPGVKRVDIGKVQGEQTHVHLNDGRALNRDGTWKHGEGKVDKAIEKWLRENGWTPPQ